MENLTKLDWQIYNILKTQNDWITQKELCLKILYDNRFATVQKQLEYELIKMMSNEDFHNTKWRHIITKSIRELNSSSVIQKIILSTGKGIKIANREEYEHFIGRKIMSAVRHLQRVKKLADKASKDGQMRIVFNRERDTIEAFVKNFEEINNEQVNSNN